MGIKIGTAHYAASMRSKDLPQGLYLRIDLDKRQPFDLAQMIISQEKGEVRYALRFPHGELGHLHFSRGSQSTFLSVEEFPWVPTKVQMKALSGNLESSKIVFDDNYLAREMPHYVMA